MVENIEEVPEIPKDDTTPNGNTGAHDKENDVEEKEPEKTEVQGAKVDKWKRVVDAPTVDTPPVKGLRTLPQISINLDGPLDIGQISPTEKLMPIIAVQA